MQTKPLMSAATETAHVFPDFIMLATKWDGAAK
jgi:hypothetical protein